MAKLKRIKLNKEMLEIMADYRANDLYSSLEDSAFNLIEGGFLPDNETVMQIKALMTKLKNKEHIDIEDQKFILSIGISLI